MHTEDDSRSLPEFPAERLAGFQPDILTDLLHLHEDRLPRTVIEECARRGDAMVDALSAIAQDSTYWSEAASDGEWWALHHAVMILGLIPSERAGAVLVDFMRRIDAAADDNLQDWLDGTWPALFANKPAVTQSELHALVLDRKAGWYMRIQALDTLVAAAEREGSAVLDECLDWVAGIAADETQDWNLRLMSARDLLAFAPERHRPLLEDLARRQSRREAAFTAQEVVNAYAGERDPPDWRERSDPWIFYDHEKIVERQENWQKSVAEEMSDDVDVVPTYVREAPKVGRNDPCPCGSGKKYKRCCLVS